MIQANAGKVVCELIPDEVKLKSGLYVARKKRLKPPIKGKVVSVGTPYTNKKSKQFYSPAAVGDIVHVKKQVARKFTWQDKIYFSVWFDEIVGVEE